MIVKSLDGIEIQEKRDFVKIDVEGFEAQVLLGAKVFLKKHKPIMVIEMHIRNFDESHKTLQSVGYEIIEKINIVCVAK